MGCIACLLLSILLNKRVCPFNEPEKKERKITETTYFESEETNDYTKSEVNDRLNQPDETPN